eukprot:7982240-Pyramimonas_sp.AAC.1
MQQYCGPAECSKRCVELVRRRGHRGGINLQSLGGPASPRQGVSPPHPSWASGWPLLGRPFPVLFSFSCV